MELTPAQRLAVDSNKKEILVSASALKGRARLGGGAEPFVAEQI